MGAAGTVLAYLSVALFALPLLFVAVRVAKVPLRAWLPIAVPIGVLLLLHVVVNVLPPDFFPALMLWVAMRMSGMA